MPFPLSAVLNASATSCVVAALFRLTDTAAPLTVKADRAVERQIHRAGRVNRAIPLIVLTLARHLS